MDIKTLADFKRYLANGGKIQLISVDGQPPAEKIAGIKSVDKMQVNSCKFIGGSWLYFPKAAYFKVNNNIITLEDESQRGGLVYKLIA